MKYIFITLILFLTGCTKEVKINNVQDINYKNISFLFTGDAEKAEESQILNKNYDIQSDVLKVAHHGSRTSSTKKFIEKLLPNQRGKRYNKDEFWK